MTYTPERTNADVNPRFAETETPADGSYAALNEFEPEGGKFSLPMGAIVGVGAFVESNAAVVEETDVASVVAATVELVTAAEVEELASATVVVVAAAVEELESATVVVVAAAVEELESATVVVVAAAVVVAAVVDVPANPPGGQQIASDCLISSQIPSPTCCLAASVNKSPQTLPWTVGTVALAVITPSQTTQDPDAVVDDAASVATVVELPAATVLLTAAAVELAAAVLLAAAAAVVDAVSVVVAATVVDPLAGQHTLSNSLIRPQIALSEPNPAASDVIVPQVLPPSVCVSGSAVIPSGHTEQVSGDGATVVAAPLAGQQMLSNAVIRPQIALSASNLAASSLIDPQVLTPSVGVLGSTVIS